MAPRRRARTEEEELAALAALGERNAAMTEELRTVRSERDLLILALYRRGVSLRRIAKAAGVHYTRVKTLAEQAERLLARNNLKASGLRRTKRKTT